MNEEQPSWIGFANVQLALGRTGIAAQLYDAALPHLRVQCGDLHSSTLACRMNLGVALGEEGDVVKAETHLTEVLAAYRATLTDANPDTLSAMASLGIVLERARRPEEAKAYLRDALRLRRAALGGTHPDTLSSIATLAACLGNQGELDEAEQLLVEAADGHRLIAERTGGDGTTALLSCTLNIAIMRDLREDWPGAEAAYGDALSLARQLPGETAQDMAQNATNRLVRVLLRQRKRDAAEAVLTDNWRQQCAAQGSAHADTLAAAELLSKLLTRRRKFPEAATLWREVLDACRAAHGDAAAETTAVAQQLAACLRSQGETAELAELELSFATALTQLSVE